MSLTAFWAGRCALFFALLTCVLVGMNLFADEEGAGRIHIQKYIIVLEKQCKFLRWKVTGQRLFYTELGLSLLIIATSLLSENLLLLLCIPVIVISPHFILEQAAAKRITLIETQIEPWLNAVANALKASPSIGEAIESSLSLVPNPMRQELDLLVKECVLGTPLDIALDNFVARVPSQTLSGTILAFKVARKSGGNFPHLLESSATALRELARLEGVVRAKTAESKMQAFVIGIIPIPLIVAVHFMDPQFFLPLTETFTGNLIIGIASGMWLSAIALARKILTVDI